MNQYPSRERMEMSSIICSALQTNWLLRSACQVNHSKLLRGYFIKQFKLKFVWTYFCVVFMHTFLSFTQVTLEKNQYVVFVDV